MRRAEPELIAGCVIEKVCIVCARKGLHTYLRSREFGRALHIWCDAVMSGPSSRTSLRTRRRSNDIDKPQSTAPAKLSAYTAEHGLVGLGGV